MKIIDKNKAFLAVISFTSVMSEICGRYIYSLFISLLPTAVAGKISGV